MHDIIGSVVIYRNGLTQVQETVASFLSTQMNVRLYVVDNSPDDRAREICKDGRVTYIFNGRNLGFGAAHNIALRASMGNTAYHVVLNPDVYFSGGVLEALLEFARGHPNVGLLMPKILNPDGSIQYLCKKLPTPSDLILRRFLPRRLKPLVHKRMARYELRDRDYTKTFSVPALSGCFMMINTAALSQVGLFDERYFMYLEDVDLCRRIGESFETIYYPEVAVYHHYAKGSYRNIRLMMHHVVSALLYFQKWGWHPEEGRLDTHQESTETVGRGG
jgi:GT2 family glycosyltransferase